MSGFLRFFSSAVLVSASALAIGAAASAEDKSDIMILMDQDVRSEHYLPDYLLLGIIMVLATFQSLKGRRWM